MRTIKQVIVLREDLKCSLGKKMAQVAHASMRALTDQFIEINVMDHDEGAPEQSMYYSGLLLEEYKALQWLNGSFTKIVVGCDSEKELLNLKKQAEDFGITHALIECGGQEVLEIDEPITKCSFCSMTQDYIETVLSYLHE